MGKRGPQPTPTALRLLRGNPGRRSIKRNEPSSPTTNTEPPDWLPPDACAEWFALMPSLCAMRMFTDADRSAFAAYCVSFAAFKEATENLKKFGSVIRMGKTIIPSPYVSIANKAQIAMQRWAREFGFTPASRSALSVKPDDKGGKLAEWKKKYEAT